ncbi:MAG: hypothetical protein GY854_08190 [Deltaproteobacteria bacterium]|nr:hypothetical protein [Deltaproteobacteria bacterium]
MTSDFPAEITPGLIVSVTGEAGVRTTANGTVVLSSTMPTVTLADEPSDKAVFGVVTSEAELRNDHWYQNQIKNGDRFVNVNALGEGRVWVCDFGGDIGAGDYLTTSSVPGHGMKQDDDLLHNYTLGKATETIDWQHVDEFITINGKSYKLYLLAVVYTSG